MTQERVWEPCEGLGRGLRIGWGEKTWTESSWESGQLGGIKSLKLNRHQAVTKASREGVFGSSLSPFSSAVWEAEREKSCSAVFCIIITKTSGYSLCFLTALRNALASLDLCDYWLNISVGGPAFLLIHLTMHKVMGACFSFLHEIFLFDGALDKNDDNLRCSTTLLGGQKFSSWFLAVRWGVGSLANYSAGGPLQQHGPCMGPGEWERPCRKEIS